MSNILTVGAPLPASLGSCADLLHDVRDLRLEMQKQVDAIEAREKEIVAHLINSLDVSKGDAGVSGQRYRAEIEIDRKARVAPEGWGVFCSWVRKNDRFDLLTRRLNDTAVAQTQAAEGRVLPGLEMVNVKRISLTKR